MFFNPDAKKPAKEIRFTNCNYTLYDTIFFAEHDIMAVSNHKHLGLNNKLTSSKHIDDKIKKPNTGIVIIRRVYNYSPRNALLQVYKSFLRPHLDYCDVIYHKPIYDDFSKEYYSERAPTDPMKINAQFTNELEPVQYNSALAITGCVRGTSKEKLYIELGLSSLCDRRQFHLFTIKSSTDLPLRT